jgi:hypothetical protein
MILLVVAHIALIVVGTFYKLANFSRWFGKYIICILRLYQDISTLTDGIKNLKPFENILFS